MTQTGIKIPAIAATQNEPIRITFPAPKRSAKSPARIQPAICMTIAALCMVKASERSIPKAPVSKLGIAKISTTTQPVKTR